MCVCVCVCVHLILDRLSLQNDIAPRFLSKQKPATFENWNLLGYNCVTGSLSPYLRNH